MTFLLELDKSLLIHINRVWTSPWLDSFFPAITDLHKSTWFLAALIPLIFALFLWRYRREGFLLFFLLLLALGTSDLVGNRGLKKNIERLRPGDAIASEVVVRSPYGGYSFTSNHAANMFCFAKYVSEFVPQARLLTYSAAFLVSYSRVYNGVHYPSDVFVGGLLGWAIGWMYSILGKRLFEKFRKRTLI